MKTTVDTQTYYAKSGLFGNPWRTSHTTQADAVEQAKHFVRSWLHIGVNASAIVFYRDGSAIETITPEKV